ncbi:MAG: hypothetical protein WCK42_09350, partial [Myxococcaceae bacterium]
FGESFAGSYVPWITTELLNSKPAVINLPGMAIGDGTVDMLANWETTADYAFQRGLISQSEREFALNNLLPACREQVLKYRQTNVFMSPVYCQIMEDFLLRAANVQNVYDYREERQYAFDVAACYLNKPQVQKALGVDRTWSQDNETVFSNLTNQADKPTVCEIQDIIKKIRVLIYTGNQDFLINYLGTEKWFSEMTQGKYTSCNNIITMSTEIPWIAGQETAGTIRKNSSGDLWFVKIDNAGHLVPKNQPRAAKYLLEQFLGL